VVLFTVPKGCCCKDKKFTRFLWNKCFTFLPLIYPEVWTLKLLNQLIMSPYICVSYKQVTWKIFWKQKEVGVAITGVNRLAQREPCISKQVKSSRECRCGRFIWSEPLEGEPGFWLIADVADGILWTNRVRSMSSEDRVPGETSRHTRAITMSFYLYLLQVMLLRNSATTVTILRYQYYPSFSLQRLRKI
jgi:hypothetical protein